MSKKDYLQKLSELLSDISAEEREEALDYYRDYFEDAGEGEEERVMRELGSPEKVAAQIKDGISMGDRERDDVFGSSGSDSKERTDDRNTSRPGENSETYRENGYGRDGYRGSSSRQGKDQDSRYRKDSYRQDGYQEGGYRQNEYQDSRYQKEGYRQNGYGNGGCREDTYRPNEYQEEGVRPQRRGSSGGAGRVLLIVLLCILAVPVGIPLLTVAFGLAVTVLALVFCGVLTLGILMVVFCVIGVVLFGAGVSTVFTLPGPGLLMAGVGLILLALGLLVLLLVIWAGGTVIPAVVRGIVNLIQRPFRKRGGERI